jgi:imidazolonepropionase-like amidohydrolase
MKLIAIFALLFSLTISATAQAPVGALQQFVRVSAGTVVLKNVRIIDGTGAAPVEGRNITIVGDKIALITAAGDAGTIPADATVLDLAGYTVLPGLVGMHNHMFFPQGGSPPIYSNMSISFPRLYLAMGVTTVRTTGSVSPYADLEVKRLIDAGRMLGPKVHVTAPYLEGKGSFTPVMRELTGVDDARSMVRFWAEQGATSFKAYMNITRDELRAVVEEADKLGLKVTGHLCSVGYKEAAEIGIDNLEHGLLANSEYSPSKKPDVCPNDVSASILNIDINGPEVQETIRVLVEKRVAITSTLPVFEAMAPVTQSGIGAASALLNPRMLNTMSPEARLRYLSSRSRTPANSPMAALIRKSMDFERAFAKAGGLLITGLDPTGNGGVVAGFGDLRGVELLVEAGFTPVEAIKIATLNGAVFLGEDSRIGSIAVGKAADLMIVKGDPAAKIGDINNVEIVLRTASDTTPKSLSSPFRGLWGLDNARSAIANKKKREAAHLPPAVLPMLPLIGLCCRRNPDVSLILDPARIVFPFPFHEPRRVVAENVALLLFRKKIRGFDAFDRHFDGFRPMHLV